MVVKDYDNLLHQYVKIGTRKMEETFYVVSSFLALPRDKNPCYVNVAAQHRRAVDAAGAAPNLGAIYGCCCVPPAVPVHPPASSAAESWRWAVQSMRGADKNTCFRKRVPST